MTFASLYNLTTVKESVNLGSLTVKEVEVSKQDWEKQFESGRKSMCKCAIQ